MSKRSRQITYKVVYFGPGLSGKTTNLEVIYQKTPPQYRSELCCISTEKDKKLYFDFFPKQPSKSENHITLRLFTVPGALFRDPNRTNTLANADGIIFVADSQKKRLCENRESFERMRRGLIEHDIDINSIPLVIQWNKRDMPNICTVNELEKEINVLRAPSYEAIAPTGEGVFPSLKKLYELMTSKSLTK